MWPLRRPGPAPPPLRYRLKRLWRRRAVRRAVTVQGPAVVLAVAAALVFSDARVHAALGAQVSAFRTALTARPEFAIRRVEITGASPTVEAEMRAALFDVIGASSLAVDAAALRRRMERLGWIAGASVSLEAPDLLRIAARERVPAAVWRIDGELWLIDRQGAQITALFSRNEYPRLPLLAGQGAEAAVPEALDVLAAAGPLRGRVRGLVRLGARRWDVVLDRDMTIRLPMAHPGASEGAPAAAMRRAVAMHRRDGVMDRDILALDLRVPHLPTLRLPPRAFEAMTRAQAAKRGGRET
jgi:cell division protein FtsQ